MRECCKGCTYRSHKSSCGEDMCTYIILNGEPRGCEPEECKQLGKYRKGRGVRRSGYGQLWWLDE